MSDEGTRALLEVANAILAEIRGLRQDRATARPAPSHGGGGQRATGGTGARFGNYGRNKGGLVEGAPMADLEYYAGGCRRSLADPSKGRFHDSERVLLAAIEAEIARQSGVAPASENWGGMPGGDDEPNF